MADHPQLLLEPPLGLVAGAAPRVALLEPDAADLRQLAVGRAVLRAGVAVAEVLGEVETQPLSQPPALGDSLGMLAEAIGHPLRRREHVRAVAAPGRLGLVERRAQPHGHHRVLKGGAVSGVRMDVSSGDAGHFEPLGQLGQQPVAPAVVAPEGPLELDPEALRPKGAQEPSRPRSRLDGPVVHQTGHSTVARAARQADDPLRVLLEVGERDAGLLVERVLPGPDARARPLPAHPLARPAARPRVRTRDQATEVRVARPGLAEQRHVRAVVERELGARDRPDAVGLERLGHLHGAVEPVVVGQRERLVTLLGGGGRELHRVRGSVQEGEGRMAVELDV